MSWDRIEAARHLSSESTATIVGLLIDSESEAAALAGAEISKVVRFVDEAAARLAHGGSLRIAAAGPVAHLVRYAVEETLAWFPGVLPVTALTAEDDATDEDAIALVDESVCPEDILLSVSRGGSRSWTCAAIRKANMIGALTASITCVPDSPVSRESDMPIVVATGAEVVMGSTQYRAGTAVKVVLDGVLLALAALAGGLRGDAAVLADMGADSWRLVAAVAGVDHLEARSLLARSGGDALVAIVMAKLGLEVDEARLRLTESNRRLDALIGKA